MYNCSCVPLKLLDETNKTVTSIVVHFQCEWAVNIIRPHKNTECVVNIMRQHQKVFTLHSHRKKVVYETVCAVWPQMLTPSTKEELLANDGSWGREVTFLWGVANSRLLMPHGRAQTHAYMSSTTGLNELK